jgi:hypothetical protein
MNIVEHNSVKIKQSLSQTLRESTFLFTKEIWRALCLQGIEVASNQYRLKKLNLFVA